MKCYYGTDLNEKRKSLLAATNAKALINEVIARADEAIHMEIPALKISEYTRYYETGDRQVYEQKYFSRRRNCCFLMMALWLTEDEKYVTPLVDYITYICDEGTWCLPAHINYPERNYQVALEHIDLFQGETAKLFGEIVMCVGDRLPEWIRERMDYEIHRRIFASLTDNGGMVEGKSYWWESCKMNWATVCGAGCMMAALAFGTEEEKERLATRFIGCLDTYLDGIEEDGCCQEGVSYWNYGFGNFVRLAEMIRVYTEGKVNYFQLPKVKALALFPQRVRMTDAKTVSFSDAVEQFEFPAGILSLLKSIYPEVVLPDLKYRTWGATTPSLSDVLWFDENYEKEEEDRESVEYFASTQWYINRKKGYRFAAKGGNNGEPHNHNDVGSFSIVKGEESFLVDLGAGQYRKETFLPETRYTLLQNSSRGHSVPIINGEYQQVGAEFCAKNVKVTDRTFQLDLEGAYLDGLIEKITRTFTFFDDKILFCDKMVPSAQTKTITERLISRKKPELSNGCIDLGVGKILYDSEKYKVEFSTDTYAIRAENRDTEAEDAVVYLIDLMAKDEKQMEFQLEFVLR